MPTFQKTSSPKLFRNFFIKLFSKTNCMKTNSPNVLFNHQAIFLLEKTSQVMKQKLLLILMLVSFYSGVFAQGARTSQNGTIVLTEVNSLLSTNGTTARQSSSGTVNVNRLRDLLTQVQPSTYFFEGIVKTYGDVPTNLFTDLRSLNQVNNSIALKQNIEIATITINSINEINSTIDLSAFSNFPNLKYIYFISNVNTTGNNISSHLINYDTRFEMIYKIDKGDRNQ